MKKTISSPYPMIEQMLEEEGTEGSFNEGDDPEYLAKGGVVQHPSEMRMAYGGFTPSWKDDMSKYMDTHFNPNQTNVIPPQNMAFGNEDVQPNQTSEVQPNQSVQLPAFNPQSGLPPPPPTPIPQPVQDPLQAQLGGYKSDMAKYGPEQQMAVEQAILKQRQGLPQVAGNAMTGLADALMQGVARAGPSNFQANLQNRNQQTEQGMREAIKTAQSGKMSQISQEMKLAMDDPKSPLSMTVKKSQAPTLLKLGWTQDQIDEVSGNTADEAAKSSLGYFESKSRADEAKALHELQAGTAGRTLAETHDRNVAEQKARQDALDQRNREFTAAHPIATGIQSLMEPPPSTGPLGDETIKDGKTYKWSPISNAYHLKKK